MEHIKIKLWLLIELQQIKNWGKKSVIDMIISNGKIINLQKDWLDDLFSGKPGCITDILMTHYIFMNLLLPMKFATRLK